MKAFCKETGRRYESARVQIHAVKNKAGDIVGFGRSVAQKAVWSNRKTKVNESKFTERLTDFNLGQKDLINHWSVQRNLNKSDIGKETMKYIVDHPEINIELAYHVDNPDKLYGKQWKDNIRIYASDTKTIEKTAETLIHEITHHRYDIGGSQWSECVCRAQELKHKYRRNTLTADELRSIIKEIKELYPELKYPDKKPEYQKSAGPRVLSNRLAKENFDNVIITTLKKLHKNLQTPNGMYIEFENSPATTWQCMKNAGYEFSTPSKETLSLLKKGEDLKSAYENMPEYTEDEINDLIKNNEFVQPIHLMGWLMVKKGVL